MKEIEARFLEIDMNKLRKLLKKINAKKIHDMRLYRRQMFELCNAKMKKDMHVFVMKMVL